MIVVFMLEELQDIVKKNIYIAVYSQILRFAVM